MSEPDWADRFSGLTTAERQLVGATLRARGGAWGQEAADDEWGDEDGRLSGMVNFRVLFGQELSARSRRSRCFAHVKCMASWGWECPAWCRLGSGHSPFTAGRFVKPFMASPVGGSGRPHRLGRPGRFGRFGR